MRKALVAAVLGSLLLAVSPAPAYAHADLVRSTPANAAVLAKAPTSIRLDFSEAVTLDAARVLDSSGTEILTRAVMNGRSLTLTPSIPMRAGIITTTYAITSDDGHQVEGAITFLIGRSGARGATQRIATEPAVPTRLSGSRPGVLTATFSNRATSGDVVWTSPELAGSLSWPVHARGRLAEARGVLPFAGTWKMRATLVSAKGTIIITNGTATLNP